MTKSYTPGLSTDKDKVRFIVGDMKADRMILEDEDINALLALYSLGRTSVVCAQSLASYYADQVSTSNGRISVGAQARYEHFTKLATDIAKRGDNPLSGTTYRRARPIVVSTSKSDKERADLDVDNVQPQFKRTQNDYPGILNSNDPSYND